MQRSWTEAFRRASGLPAVFRVSEPFESELMQWLQARPLPSVYSGGMYESSATAWAVLDGGISHVTRYGFFSLPSGFRVFGWQTLRLLVGDFGLRPPSRALAGEPSLPHIDELRRRYAMATEDDVQAIERAEVLASAKNADTLRWAVAELFGDAGLGAVRGPDDRALGDWGEHGFCVAAADLLGGALDSKTAAELARQLRPGYGRSTPMLADLADYEAKLLFTAAEAREILARLQESSATGGGAQ